MKRCILLALSPVKFGGWVTFTRHLARALRSQGYAPHIVRIGKRSERKMRDYGDGLGYQNLSLLDACSAVLGSGRGLVVYSAWRKCAEQLPALLDAGAGLVLHDPTEWKGGGVLPYLPGRRVVAIRRANVAALSALGVQARFVPHPWAPTEVDVDRAPTCRAVAISRIDFDKATHIIADANQRVAPACRVQLHGAENRIYTHHKLDKEFPGWRANYHGRFPPNPGFARWLAAGAECVVDLSTIAGDGGGTQYTFMEAWQAGRPLVVNRGWLRGDDDTMSEGVNCAAVADAAELAGVLEGSLDAGLVEGGRATLTGHRAEAVVPALVDALGWS